MEPLTLLKSLLAIEKSAGRERKEKWGPRTLDIDITYLSAIIIFPTDNYLSIRAFYRNFWKSVLSKNIYGKGCAKNDNCKKEFQHKKETRD